MVAVLLLAGCATATPPQAYQEHTVAGDDALAGTRWQVVSVSGRTLPQSIRATLAFEPDGRISGTAGCNRYTGAYRVSGTGLEVTQLVTTRKLCFAGVMAQEESLLRVLRNANAFERKPGQLLLHSNHEDDVSRLTPIDGLKKSG